MMGIGKKIMWKWYEVSSIMCGHENVLKSCENLIRYFLNRIRSNIAVFVWKVCHYFDLELNNL